MFLLKKIISAFLLPVPIGFFLLFVGFIYLLSKSYNKAKAFLFIGILWFVLLSNQTISNAILAPLENSHSALLDTPKVNYILVLGNKHTSDKNLSITSQVKETAINRLVEGIRHYQNLDNAKLIVSGYGFSDENSHAFMQESLALSLGVKKDDIIRLDTPKDTKEEAVQTKQIVKDEKFILVTSASHMKRSSLLFEKEGLNFYVSPTNYKVSQSNYPSSYFNADNLQKVELAFHEYLGLIYSYLKGEI